MSAYAELMSVPVGELIESVGMCIGDAQFALDLKGVEIAKLMAGMEQEAKITLGTQSYSMLELGLTPTFYQFVETLIEVKISISITKSKESTVTRKKSSSTTKSTSSGAEVSFFGIGGGSTKKSTSVRASSVNASSRPTSWASPRSPSVASAGAKVIRDGPAATARSRGWLPWAQ